jgi:hypothetical protein
VARRRRRTKAPSTSRGLVIGDADFDLESHDLLKGVAGQGLLGPLDVRIENLVAVGQER